MEHHILKSVSVFIDWTLVQSCGLAQISLPFLHTLHSCRMAQSSGRSSDTNTHKCASHFFGVFLSQIRSLAATRLRAGGRLFASAALQQPHRPASSSPEGGGGRLPYSRPVCHPSSGRGQRAAGHPGRRRHSGMPYVHASVPFSG